MEGSRRAGPLWLSSLISFSKSFLLESSHYLKALLWLAYAPKEIKQSLSFFVRVLIKTDKQLVI